MSTSHSHRTDPEPCEAALAGAFHVRVTRSAAYNVAEGGGAEFLNMNRRVPDAECLFLGAKVRSFISCMGLGPDFAFDVDRSESRPNLTLVQRMCSE